MRLSVLVEFIADLIRAAGYDQVLKLAGTGYQTVVACALGYRAANDKYATLPKVRYDVKELVQHV